MTVVPGSMVVVPDPLNAPPGPQVSDPLMVVAPAPVRLPVRVVVIPLSETGPAAVTSPVMSTAPVPDDLSAVPGFGSH